MVRKNFLCSWRTKKNQFFFQFEISKWALPFFGHESSVRLPILTFFANSPQILIYASRNLEIVPSFRNGNTKSTFNGIFFIITTGDCPSTATLNEDLIFLEAGKVMCNLCGITMNNPNIGRHFREVHGPDERVQCPVCKNFYKNERIRNNHAYNVHGLKADQIRSIRQWKMLGYIFLD